MAGTTTDLVPADIRTAITKFFKRGMEIILEEEVEETRKGRIGVARTRFKEGFTDESQFITELRLLRVSDEEIDLELAAAVLDYATDLTRDLIAAYQAAVRAGNIDIEQYRQLLLNLGILPERVEGYVLKEVARVKPEQTTTGVTPAKLYYETDTGKIIVDTIRRLRRKRHITKDQEITQLQGLGMTVELARAMADNDDAREAEKLSEEEEAG